MFNDDNEVIRVFGKMTEITAQREQINELSIQASRDGLTSVYNCNTVKRLISEYLKIPQLTIKRHAFIIVDLDNFKEINDTFGHLYGDNVLKETAKILTDSFNHDDFVGRIGGDEFIVFMKNYPNISELYAKTQLICNKLQKTYCVGDLSVDISASIGVALCPEHSNQLDDLYEFADIALYGVKAGGKNNVGVYNHETRPAYYRNRTAIDN